MESVKELFDQQVAEGSVITEEGYLSLVNRRIEAGIPIADWLNESIIGQNMVYFLDYKPTGSVEIMRMIYPREYEQFTKDYVVYGEANTKLPKVIKRELVAEVEDKFNPGVYVRDHD